MRPSAPPSVVAAVCGKFLDDQARETGMSPRNFARMIRGGWGAWRVEAAEKWCAVCGFDFWNLDVSHRIRTIPWSKLTPVYKRALRGLLRYASGKDPTMAEIRELARVLTHG